MASPHLSSQIFSHSGQLARPLSRRLIVLNLTAHHRPQRRTTQNLTSHPAGPLSRHPCQLPLLAAPLVRRADAHPANLASHLCVLTTHRTIRRAPTHTTHTSLTHSIHTASHTTQLTVHLPSTHPSPSPNPSTSPTTGAHTTSTSVQYTGRYINMYVLCTCMDFMCINSIPKLN